MEDLKPQVSSTPQSQSKGTLHHNHTFLLLYLTLFPTLFVFLLTTRTVAIPSQAQTLPSPSSQPVQSVVSLSTALTPPTAGVIPSEAPQGITELQKLRSEKQSIKEYIGRIFGKEAPTAFAIALAEAGHSYQGERFFKTDAIHQSDFETSVGLFQINLKNKATLVHYNRIPGSTLEEKIMWLQNPYNNVLFAYWIYSTSTFAPWSVYSDGTYLVYLK